jgi:hypothetical protein
MLDGPRDTWPSDSIISLGGNGYSTVFNRSFPRGGRLYSWSITWSFATGNGSTYAVSGSERIQVAISSSAYAIFAIVYASALYTRNEYVWNGPPYVEIPRGLTQVMFDFYLTLDTGAWLSETPGGVPCFATFEVY